MTVTALDHVYVETTRFDATRAFWEGLGFTVESAWGEGDHRACQLVSGDARIVLATAHGDAEPVAPTVHLRVPDGDAAQRVVETNDHAQVQTPLSHTHWGTRWIRVADPDGNTWVLEEPAR